MHPAEHPIIYVRGFAATMAEIDETTADPYMGFNRGSTVLRQNADLAAVRFIFESPLMRLIKDHGYCDAFDGGDYRNQPGSVPARSIWIFRYYERSSQLLGNGERLSMEEIALDLRRFILRVREAVCGDDEQRRAGFKVHLVAHSMGGLVCRCYLQNICRHGIPKDVPAPDRDALELAARGATPHLVDKLFTYGTPHNGIDLLGVNVPDLGSLDRWHVANFDRDRMREYLRLSGDDVPVNDLDGAFDPQRVFCFIGSNYKDYDAFFGLSKKGTGPASDGLVMIANAWVRDAPRAITRCSHSGPYGLVNSESGYQNLRRFLFGSLRVTAQLLVDRVDLPPGVQKKYDAGHKVRGSYHFDTATTVRGAANFTLNERRYEHASALLLTYDALTKRGKPAYLFTGYLTPLARAASDTALMFAIDFGVRVPLFEVDHRFWFDEHFEGFMFQEQISLAIRASTIRYGLARKDGFGNAPHAADVQQTEDGTRIITVAVATAAGARPGFAGRLRLTVEPWS